MRSSRASSREIWPFLKALGSTAILATLIFAWTLPVTSSTATNQLISKALFGLGTFYSLFSTLR